MRLFYISFSSDASKNRKKTEKQTDQNPFTNIQNNALMPLVQELSDVRKKLEMEAVKLKIEVAKLTEEKEILLTRYTLFCSKTHILKLQVSC